MFKDKLFNATLADELSKIQDVQTKNTGMEQAFAELYQILKHCNQEVMSHIPGRFLQVLQRYMDPDWKGSLDFSKRLSDMEMLDDTRFLLHLIHRDFLCSETEREELIKLKTKEAAMHGSLTTILTHWDGCVYPMESLYELMDILD